MNWNAGPYDEFAPLTPGEETQTAVDPKFRDACYDLVRPVCKDAIFGVEFFSESEKWGKIFRVDFTVPDFDWPTRINRVVCSQKGEGEGITFGIAIGQEIVPLPLPNSADEQT